MLAKEKITFCFRNDTLSQMVVVELQHENNQLRKKSSNMKNSEQPIHPFEVKCKCDKTTMMVKNAGLTKREYFAGLAMQGLIANGQMSEHLIFWKSEESAKISVFFADALLAELEKPQQP